MLIALGASIWPGKFLSIMAWAGIKSVPFGILILIFSRGKKSFSKALLPAFTTALMVAAYSIIDGIGVRVSGAPLSYITWLFTTEICVTLFVIVPRFSLLRNNGLRPFLFGFFGGILSSVSSALAVFAQTLAPLALVAAVRETSVIIAATIGVLWFREKPIYMRLTAASVVAIGIILIVLS